MEAILISGATALSVTFFAYGILLAARGRSPGPLPHEGEVTEVNSIPIRLLLPYGRSVGVVLTRRAEAIRRGGAGGYGAILMRMRARVLRLILAAGNPGGMNPDEFLGLVIVCGILGLGLGLLFGILFQGWVAVMMTTWTILGLFFPVSWLRGQARRRTKAIRKELPYSLDLLTLAVMAGLDFTEAMMRLSGKLTGSPLGRELGLTVRSIQLGRSRADALRELSFRVGMVEMSSVVGSIIQADELGASLGPILRIQAEQIRTRRFHNAEEQAMKAPVKIIFPLALCILPTTMLIIFGSLAIPYLPAIWDVIVGGSKLGIQ